MAQYPNNPDELERFRRATTLSGVGAAPVTSVQPKTLPQPAQVRPKPAPRPGYSYQPGTPGYESLNIFQRMGLQPHFNVPKPAPAAPRPAAAPMAAPAAAPGAAKSPIQQLYEFLKGDLTRESEKARAAATVDASNRGVFYGQPLTAMGQDIDERYTRGLAQLQSSLIQNEQGNELERMRLALASLGPMQAPEVPAFPSDAFASLGAAFTQPAPVPNKPVTTVPPSYEKVGDKVKKKEKVD